MSEIKIALGKWLAQQGVASRRRSVELIKEARVKVNDHIVTEPFTRISGSEIISVDGEFIKKSANKEYYAVYKPTGYVSSTETDDKGRPPVTRLVRSAVRLYPVGRLDIDSEGLLILTNDGNVTFKLTHPKFAIKKTYKILVGGRVSEEKIRRLQNGILLKEGRTKPAIVLILGKQQGKTWMEISISEGKYHQVRRMFARVSLHVERLIRTREGNVSLGDLEPGQWRKLDLREMDSLDK